MPPSRMTIVVDTREQRPWRFRRIQSSVTYVVETGKLATGDYSIAGYEDQICVERKTLADAYGTFGKGRARFERELDRMRAMDRAAIVIEASWYELAKIQHRPRYVRRMTPRAMIASLTAWMVRYGVQVIAAGGESGDAKEARRLSEILTFRFLERFWRDMQSAENPKATARRANEARA